jgi:uncharacterized membrane protein
MGLLERRAPNLYAVLDRDAWWMTWNTLLAWIPVVLAVGLFRYRAPGAAGGPGRTESREDALRGERSLPWWCGVGLFVLFLPNAPYVVTDLIHLGDDVRMVPGSWPVVTAVLPVYAVFIGSGFLAYYLALAEMGRYMDRAGYAAWRGITVIGIHAICAVGVYLGRRARLNSWEPVVEPHGTLERIVLSLSWRGAPVFIAATFLVTWAGYFVTKAVVESAWSTGERTMRSVLRL